MTSPRAASTDVARLAGVSQKTVSRVMNGEPHVRPELRERVMRAAQQLNYRPNAAARSLLSGRSNRLGVVSLGAKKLYGPAGMVAAVEQAARSFGYATSVAHHEHGIAESIGWLMEQGVDGIVLTGDVDEGPVTITVDVPVLTIGRYPTLVAPRRIRSAEDADRNGYLATKHLIDLGHTQIRHVSGPERWWASRDRVHGWRTALTDAGLDVAEPIEGDWTSAGGYAAGRRLAADPAMTAVFVANDEMAIGVIRALHDAGRRVPGDVSVVGMDDIPSARFLNPALTTIVQDFDAVSEEGVAMLIQEITSPAHTERRLSHVEPVLAVRESTAPPPL
ncbi:LacI family DNA-binding transcriptional regulator [Actinoplanes sp. NPDC000266]